MHTSHEPQPSDRNLLCVHCDSPVPPGSSSRFCCKGCEVVYGLLHEEGLDRYYDIAPDKLSPVPTPPAQRSYSWLEPLVAQSEARGGELCRLDLDIQGVHCAACVWLIDELFRREEGGASLLVNPGLGKVQLAWRRGLFDVQGFLSRVERFGYLFGPSRKEADGQSRSLLLRIGVTAAIASNVMLFYLAFYTGLAPEDGKIFDVFTQLIVVLSAAAVAVGGWPFFRSAWHALRRGLLHLDLPIALGILLAFGVSFHQARDGRGDLTYFDTLNVFVLLMLTGRWLQQRILDRNRRYLLEDGGADAITVRRREGKHLVAVQAPQLRSGDHIVLAPGDLLPVDGQALEEGSFATDWITGEPDIRGVGPGDELPAGACNAGSHSVTLIAKTNFADSPLPNLLRGSASQASRSTHLRFWDRLARYYVTGVLLIAALGLLLWWPAGPERAIQVTVALLVVTCPCAIGLATPLAYEMAQARLRAKGLFVRNRDFLDKLPRIRKVVFDKTGTLTLGRLHLVEAEVVRSLEPELRDAAFDMSARSNHPVSRCLSDALSKAGASFSPDASVREVFGQGLELHRDGKVYRLGRSSWAAPENGDIAATVLSVDGNAAAVFRTEESIRPDARREIQALRDAGYEVWLLSGDEAGRVEAFAKRLGIDADKVRGGLRPEDKAALVRQIDREDTLFIGDGVNDSLAFEAAFAAGTPSVDRPVLPAKSDFFLLGEGIGGIRQALGLSLHLKDTVRRIIGVALAYNLLAIAASMSGWMTPLRAAIAMPTSSALILAFTITRMRQKPTQVEAAPQRVEALA